MRCYNYLSYNWYQCTLSTYGLFSSLSITRRHRISSAMFFLTHWLPIFSIYPLSLARSLNTAKTQKNLWSFVPPSVVESQIKRVGGAPCPEGNPDISWPSKGANSPGSAAEAEEETETGAKEARDVDHRTHQVHVDITLNIESPWTAEKRKQTFGWLFYTHFHNSILW